MLKLSHVCAGYGSTPVLRQVCLEVQPGEVIAILGRNGVGKTTLMKTIMGLLPTTSGQIDLDDVDISRWPAHQRARHGIGYVPQGREIFAALSIQENILTGLHPRKREEHGRSLEKQLDWILGLFPALRIKRHQRGDSLSGGQQQQLAIARALIAQPQILLLDEPSDGIQPSVVYEIVDQLHTINQQLNTTMVLVEQNLAVVQALAQSAYIMVKGSLLERLPRERLNSEDPLLQEHLGV